MYLHSLLKDILLPQHVLSVIDAQKGGAWSVGCILLTFRSFITDKVTRLTSFGDPGVDSRLRRQWNGLKLCERRKAYVLVTFSAFGLAFACRFDSCSWPKVVLSFVCLEPWLSSKTSQLDYPSWIFLEKNLFIPLKWENYKYFSLAT